MGLDFPNPVGMAAGFDRDGRLLASLPGSGLGFAEIGTVNASASDHPLLIRLAARLARARALPGLPPVGVSIGSLRDSLDGAALADYASAMMALLPQVDFFTLNLSRPGSPGRGSAVDPAALAGFLASLCQRCQALGAERWRPVPLVLKLAVEPGEVMPPAARLAGELGFDAVLAAFEGWPCRESVLRRIETLAKCLEPIPLLVVGGIRSAADVRDRLAAGAVLVQVYSALLGQGPAAVRSLLAEPV
ncbi:MAG TPA: hypothetical protein VNN09_01385 [Candidatus Competibacteraceae bacterium]|nr:hypothetical protein [Candidatus Competibacteraceae bacterium]